MDKWILIRMLVNAALSMSSDGAADMINNLASHDNDTATWIGRWINWIDDEFGQRVFERIAELQLQGGV